MFFIFSVFGAGKIKITTTQRLHVVLILNGNLMMKIKYNLHNGLKFKKKKPLCPNICAYQNKSGNTKVATQKPSLKNFNERVHHGKFIRTKDIGSCNVFFCSLQQITNS